MSGCYQNSGSKATVNVTVSWTNAPSGESILVKLGALTRTIKPGAFTLNYGNNGTSTPFGTGTIVSPQLVAFEIPADGSNFSVTANFSTTTSCQATAVAGVAPPSCVPVVCGSGNIGGIVFNDYDADGVKGSGETNGVSGIKVQVYDCQGNKYETTSTSTGSWFINASGIQYPVRVEFSNIPSIYQNSSTLQGTGSRTSVQFVTASRCDVNLGVNDPLDYCQPNPLLLVPCYVMGNPLVAGTSRTAPAIVGFPYTASGSSNNGNPDAGTTAKTFMIEAQHVGTTWGQAYSKITKKFFSAATIKRHAGLGPGGLDAIYITNISTPGSPSTPVYFNLGGLGIDVGTSSFVNNTTRGLQPNKDQPSRDNEGFAAIGKIGIGGISISSDNKTLWLMNVKDNSLYALDLTIFNISGNAADITKKGGPFTLPSPSCTRGVQRSWATKFYKDKVYVGSICDGSVAGTRSDLKAVVYSYDPVANTFASVFDFPLTYPKGYPNKCDVDATSSEANSAMTGWNPWSDNWGDLFINNSCGAQGARPMLTDIEFDTDGSMILGFNDRTGLQTGYQNYAPNTSSTALYNGFVGGDILRAYASNGVFILENNAQAGPAIGYGAGNNQGVGFGEFFNDDSGDGNLSGNLYHTENNLGGLAIRPGSGQVVATVMDPTGIATPVAKFSYWSGGVRWWNNTKGQVDQAYAVYSTNTSLSSGDAFGKATGLGDVTLTCDDVSYVEIGNYIWEDQNKDGIQQACEPPIPNVKVSLYTAAGVKVASKTTNANGEYYFNQADGLKPNTAYIIVVGTDGSTNQFSGGVLSVNSKAFTMTINDTGQGDNKDLNDSDADPNALTTVVGSIPAGYPKITVTTGAFGTVNHTLDAGFWTCYLKLVPTATSVCHGSTINLSANQTGGFGTVSYSWTGPVGYNSTLANPTRSSANTTMAGTYTISASDVNGCTASATVSLTVTVVNATAAGNTVCEGGALFLSASGGNTYSWTGPNSFSATGSNPIIATATTAASGIYTVTVTGASGCTALALATINISLKPVPNATGGNVCEGETIQLSASGGGSYFWFSSSGFSSTLSNPTRTGATTAMAGTYSVTVTGTNSCTQTGTATVSVRPKPVVTVTGANVCEGATIQLSATGGGSYSWAGPSNFTSTIANPTRTNAATDMTGTYSVTVTGTNSCTQTGTTTVTVRSSPVVTATGNNACVGGQIQLSATGGGTYSWSGPLSFASVQANPTRSGATTGMSGVYSVTVTGTNTCTNSATTSIVVDNLAPAAASGSDVCEGATITLSTSGGGTYSWSGPGGFSSAIANPTRTNATIAMAGTYSVTVTATNSCTQTGTATVVVRTNPVVTTTGSNVCEGATITLSATGGGSYSWAGPATFSSTIAAPTRANATTAMAGIYSVTVTGTNSCTQTGTTTVSVRTNPIVTSTGSDVCEGATITLSTTGGGSYSWTGPDNFSSTIANPTRANATTAMAGTYSVTVTGTNSCTQTGTTTVNVRTNPIVISTGSDVCEGATITLSTTGGGTYSWSGPATFSSTIAAPTRTNATTAMAGTYSVTVTGTNSCTQTGTTTVVVRTKPIVDMTGSDVCEGATITLSATGGGSYLWAGPATFSSTIAAPTRANATTAMAGTYSVTVTGTNSCTQTGTTTVVVRTKPIVTAFGSNACVGGQIQLSATGGGSYSWAGPSSFTSSLAAPTRSSATVAMSGTYSVTVTGTNSCTNSATTSLTVDNLAPAAAAGSDVCEGATIELSTSGGGTYSWSGPGGFSSTIANPTRTNATTAMAGIYSVTVTATNSCTQTGTATVVVRTKPIVDMTGSDVCEGATITLSATGGGVYSWTGPANFSSTIANPTRPNATTAMTGTYSVTVTGTNSCTQTGTTTVNVRTNPIVTSTGSDVCEGATIALSTTGGGSYSWTGPANFSSTIANPTRTNATTTMAGIYSVTVTGTNSCTQTGTATVAVRTKPTVVLTGDDVCEGALIELSTTGGGSYSWSGPANFTSTIANPTRNNATTAMAGTYSVTVTGTNSCTQTGTTTVVVRTKPIVDMTGSDVCEGATITLSATGGGTYTWNGPATFSSTIANPTRANATTAMAGTYSVTVTGTNSCTQTGTTTVVVRTKPIVDMTGSDVCEGATITLSATGGGSYSWAGPANFTSSIANPTRTSATTAMAGTYSVTVTGTNSCTQTGTTTVAVRTKPIVTTTGSDVCEGALIELSTTGGGSYSWSGPANFTSTIANPTRNNATTAMAGTYSVTVTGTNSCTQTGTTTVVVRTKPIVDMTGSDVCEGATITLSATGGGTYTWNGPATFSSTIANPTRANATTAMAGTYSVTVTGTNSCTQTGTTTVVVRTKPIVDMTGSDVCEGATITLSATGGGSYSWAGPANFTSSIANPTRTSATTAMAGTYSVTVTGTNSCTQTGTTTVAVRTKPIVTTTGSDVCEGGTISLSTTGGGSYSWTGPANFSSTNAAPTRSDATTAMAGTYSVTVTGTNSCTQTGTTTVVVRPKPTVVATGSDVCEGVMVNLSASGGTSYSWSGPASFTATVANPTRPNATTNMTGIYSVTVTGSNSCTQSATTSVTVRTLPTIDVSSNSPVCIGTGATISLSATGGGTYSWGGPNAFAATGANPTRSNVTTAMAGVYTVTVTGTNSCSNTATVSVIVNLQGAMAEGNGPVCANDVIELKTNAGSSYSWSGPASFSSTLQNPTRTNVTAPMAGVYSVTVQGSNSCTGSATVSVAVKALPIVGVTTSSPTTKPACEGIPVTVTATGGDNYAWSGPNNFTATGATPTISNTTTGTSGTYSVTVTGSNSCSASSTVSISVQKCFGSIGDYVWKDKDKDGIQDSDEVGVPGVTVELYNTDINGNPIGGPIGTKVTDANGGYLFDLLPSGDYKVKFIVPSNMDMAFTQQGAGNDSTKDSDANTITGFSQKVTIDTRTTGITKDNPTIDAGLIQTYGSLGDYVWFDTDKDGVQDSNELGVQGITVILSKETAPGVFTQIATQVTDANGKYLFDLLASGNYKVTFQIPSDKLFTTQDAGGNDTTDSDANPSNGMSQVVTINANGTGIAKDNPTIDAGIICIDPTFTLTPTNATCGDGVAKNNGKLTLSNVQNGTRYDFNVGTTYTNNKPYATATPIPQGGVLTDTLPNPTTPTQSYTVRVFNQDGCYTDKTVTLQQTVCDCPPAKCVPYTVIKRSK
ncbi:MAG: SdrD B-like domain-containing protein [Spirosomataceae bacterium]